MADEANKIVILFVLLCLVKYSFSTNLIPKCSLVVGSKTFNITSRTWQYKSGGYTYSINLCEGLKLKAPCVNSRICRDSGSAFHDLGGKDKSKITSSLNVDGSGFSLEYNDGTCDKTSGGKLKTWIQMKCGSTMGSPKLIDEFTSAQKGCIIVFEFITNEACKKPPTVAEVPCSFYNGTTNKKIDLSPLIKVTGGYEVMSTNFSDDFFINVCREITPEKQGSNTYGCPKGSSSCRKQTSANHAAVTIGKVMAGSLPKLVLSTGHVEMVYNTTSTVPGCKENPSTKITFACPKDLNQASGKGPIMTSVDNCMYEIFWETEYACPQDQLLSNNSCILSNEFVQFDLTPLQRPPGHNYKVNGTDIKASKNYFYYINVCRSTNIPDCSPSGYNASVCQETPGTNSVVSLGVFYQQTLTYTDGQLTLKYKGGKVCSDWFPRETIINFKCNPLADQGNPVFGGELSHCVYFFDWETKYACPPSRRTGSSCRVTSDKGIRFDLSELVRIDQSNWLAIDGETSSSDRKIYLNVCGKLSQQSETSKCDNEAAVCLVSKDGSVKSLGRYLEPPTLNSDKSVQLIYSNGDECIKGVRRKTKITFVCHPGDLTSPPVLVSHSQDDCEYTLMWETAAACSLGINVGSGCKVEDKDAGYVFDLSHIPTSPYYGSKFAPVKYKKYNYYLQVCEALNDTSQKPCFRDVGGCQVDSSSKPPKIVSIGKPNSKLYYYDGIIKLTYSDGDKCHNNKPRETHISFICNPKAPHNGDGLPEFDREEHCVYHFRWPTKYACPSKVVECAARSGSSQYDLSTLSKTDDNWQTSDSSTGKFYINVCRSLNLKPEVSGCQGTSAVCLVDNSGNFIDLGGVDKSLNVTSPGTITITYTKGSRCDTDRNLYFETQIMFICKKDATDTSPVYQSKDKCTYKFRWESASACVITNVVGSNCSVQDPKSDTKFNLFPLNRRGDNPYVMKTPDGRTFQLNICGGISSSLCRQNKNSQVAVCMNETNSNLINLGMTSQQLDFMGETLVLTYRNGDRDINNGFPRITKIRFYCNPEEPLGQPKYIEQASEKDGEVFYFDFQTSLACSAKQVQCAVMGPNNKRYDLTPLGLVNSNWEAVDTRAAYSHLHYFINICKAINPSPSSDIKCPGGAIGACQVDHKTSKGHNLGYIQSNPTVTADGEVTIRYYGGDACHGKYNRSTRINLSCSKTMGSPVFRGETPECEYIFHWETPSACPLTSEYGTNCGVTDRQYNYQFNFSSLSGKDYRASGLPGGGTVMFDVCEQISGTSCKGSNVAACLSTPGANEGRILGTVSNGITYLYGELFILYSTSTCSLKVTFECDQSGSSKQPVYESFKAPCNYSIRFPTILACRPFAHVQCSLRRESSDKKSDLQYDFTPLAKRKGNWKADTSSSSATSPTYWINVCQPIHQMGDAKSCPPAAGVCKYDPVKKRYTSLGSLRSGPVVENDNIYLWYKGGDNCKTSAGKTIQSSAKILMKCGSSSESSPQLVNTYGKTCLYEFVWVTKYACPINTGSVNITNDCTALHPQSNYKFDLNPLSDPHGLEVKDKRGYYYLLNVCKGLNDNRAKDCGTGSGSCQLSKGSTNLHHNAGNYNKLLSYNDGVLSLNYSGGEVCFHSKTNRQTLISFVCDFKTTNDLGKPVFVAETDDCSYYFTWHTRLACERKVECSPVEYGDNKNTKYNLHDLANDQQNWLVMPLDGKYKGYTFYINICRSLVPVSGVNCPPGASACMKSNDGKNVQSLGRAVSQPKVKNGKIVINYQNGTDQPQTTIELTCNQGSLGNPVFVSADSNNFVFSWATLAACPQSETPQPDKCRVYDNNTEYFYDVSPLKKVKNNHINLKAPDGSEVYASVCGSLAITGCDGDGVCKIFNKKATSLGKFQYISMAYLNDEQMLLLKYCSQTCTQQSAVVSTIMFVCDENAVSHDQYSLDSLGDGGANIIWKTNLVCPPARQQCVLSDGGQLFDLELLSSKTRSWHYTSSKGYKFWLNICRGVEDQTGCPPYATVCAQFGGRDSKIVVLGYGRTQKITRSSDGKQLLLRYTGQSNIASCTRKGVSAEVTFQFTCGSHVGTPKLIYSSFTACSFTFSWVTKAACQSKQDKLQMSNCQTKHPETGRVIDFKKIDKSPIKVQGEDDQHYYYFSLCGGKLGSSAPSACSAKSLCRGDQGYDIKSKELRYQDFAFELWFITTKKCPTKKTSYETFIINFQCSDKNGKPVFEYASSSCHYVFSWSTPIVCTKDQSGNIDDRAPGALSGSSAGKKAGIAVAVIFTLLGVAAIIFVLHNHRRRNALVVFVRSNVRKIRRKGDSSSNAVYKYQKITVDDEEDNDLLLGFSDEEEEHEHDHEEDDDEMITL